MNAQEALLDRETHDTIIKKVKNFEVKVIEFRIMIKYKSLQVFILRYLEFKLS